MLCGESLFSGLLIPTSSILPADAPAGL